MFRNLVMKTLSVLFPYRGDCEVGTVKKDKKRQMDFVGRKIAENKTEYGGFNLKD